MAKRIVAQQSNGSATGWTVDSTRAWLAGIENRCEASPPHQARSVAWTDAGRESSAPGRWKVCVDRGLLLVVCSGVITAATTELIDAEVSASIEREKPDVGIVDLRSAVIVTSVRQMPGLRCACERIAYVSQCSDGEWPASLSSVLEVGLLRMSFTDWAAATSWASRHRPSRLVMDD